MHHQNNNNCKSINKIGYYSICLNFILSSQLLYSIKTPYQLIHLNFSYYSTLFLRHHANAHKSITKYPTQQSRPLILTQLNLTISTVNYLLKFVLFPSSNAISPLQQSGVLPMWNSVTLTSRHLVLLLPFLFSRPFPTLSFVILLYRPCLEHFFV